MIYLTKTYHLKASHRLEHERHINSEKTHGHNYRLEVTLKGQPDSLSGMIISRDRLDQIVHDHIIEIFDHTHLNDQLRHASGEWIVSEWYKILKTTEIGPQLVGLQLQETAKNRFLSSP